MWYAIGFIIYYLVGVGVVSMERHKTLYNWQMEGFKLGPASGMLVILMMVVWPLVMIYYYSDPKED